jgi:hypothetical protein
MKKYKIRPALLTRTEIQWLLGRVKISKQYQYRIRSDIKQKIKTLIDLELPLLVQKGIIDKTDLSKYTQNLNANPQIKNPHFSTNTSTNEFQSQDMVGRKGCAPISVQK